MLRTLILAAAMGLTFTGCDLIALLLGGPESFKVQTTSGGYILTWHKVSTESERLSFYKNSSSGEVLAGKVLETAGSGDLTVTCMTTIQTSDSVTYSCNGTSFQVFGEGYTTDTLFNLYKETSGSFDKGTPEAKLTVDGLSVY